MKTLKLISFIFWLLFISTQAYSQGFLKTDGKKIVDGTGKPVILRGMGLGGWMLQEGYMLKVNAEGQQYRIRERIEAIIGKQKTDEFYTAWLSNHTTKADIDSLKAWGFNSVRLPMHYNLYTLPVDQEPVAGQHTWIEKGFALTDSLVAWCKANDLYLILDLHAAPGGQGNDLNISDRDPSKPSLWDSQANQEKTVAFWKKIAQRYANETTIGAYDIINEPNWGFTDLANDKNGIKEQKNEPLEKLMRDITKAIREVDRNHIVIIEGNGWGNNYNGVLDDGLWDSNMVLSFHKYWNFNDANSIAHLLKYRDQYHVPVWLGETGENSNVWYTEAIRLLESNDIGWAWWPLKKLGYNNPMQIRSDETYDQLVSYWNGRRKEVPAADAVYGSLMRIASNSNAKNTIYHPDVVDAMMRQPFTTATKPFKKHSVSQNATIQAADFDLGQNGSAYFDKDTANYWVSGVSSVGNKGGTYRNDAVDVFSDSTVVGTYYVGSIEDGEWLQYSISVKEPGSYTVQFTVAAEKAGGILSINNNLSPMVKTVNIPATGGNLKWHTVEVKGLNFDRGVLWFRVRAQTGGFNLKSIRFHKP